MTQLTLGIGLRDSATFDNYYPGPNREALSLLQQSLQDNLFLWGAASSGKSHLLQALCHHRQQLNQPVFYLPLAQHQQLQVEMLQGLEAMQLICIDDVDAIAGKRQWEEALFHLYNRCREQQTLLVITASTAPSGIAFELADLKSRLGWGLILQLQALNDEDKQALLQLRARNRGMRLNDEVANYLIKRAPRDLQSLIDLLERLDQASLTQQRKLTIPFVRELLD
jgi:DnaA family protein